MRNQVEEDTTMAMISNMYPCLYTSPPQAPPQQGEVKQKRRRRKKVRSDEGAKKRKLSDEQVEMLERSFGFEHKLESDRKDKLATELGLDPRQVAVWFQNRRARWKNKKLEDEYSRLRAEHDATVVHKCNLETQVLKLRGELEEAQKEIRRLRSSEIASSNSPSSSLTMEAVNQTMLLGDQYGTGDFDNPFYMEGDSYVVSCLDWNLYDMQGYM